MFWWEPLPEPVPQLPPSAARLPPRAPLRCGRVLQLVADFQQRAAGSNIWRWFYTKDNAQAVVNAPVYHAPTPLPNDEGSEGAALPPAAPPWLVSR